MGADFSNDSNAEIGPIEDVFGDAAVKAAALEGFLDSVIRDTSFDEFIRELLLQIVNSVKSEAGSILEINQENRSLFFRAALGQSADAISGVTIPMGKGIVGHVAESGLPMIVSNASEEKSHLKSLAGLSGFQPNNLIAVPIFIRGKTFGVLELLNRVGESEYTQADLELLTYLVQMAAKVIEIRMMFNWMNRRSTRAEAA